MNNNWDESIVQRETDWMLLFANKSPSFVLCVAVFLPTNLEYSLKLSIHENLINLQNERFRSISTNHQIFVPITRIITINSAGSVISKWTFAQFAENAVVHSTNIVSKIQWTDGHAPCASNWKKLSMPVWSGEVVWHTDRYRMRLSTMPKCLVRIFHSFSNWFNFFCSSSDRRTCDCWLWWWDVFWRMKR